MCANVSFSGLAVKKIYVNMIVLIREREQDCDLSVCVGIRDLVFSYLSKLTILTIQILLPCILWHQNSPLRLIDKVISYFIFILFSSKEILLIET